MFGVRSGDVCERRVEHVCGVPCEHDDERSCWCKLVQVRAGAVRARERALHCDVSGRVHVLCGRARCCGVCGGVVVQRERDGSVSGAAGVCERERVGGSVFVWRGGVDVCSASDRWAVRERERGDSERDVCAVPCGFCMRCEQRERERVHDGGDVLCCGEQCGDGVQCVRSYVV
jgi:hypothetical protein